jgi:hypothetical protein
MSLAEELCKLVHPTCNPWCFKKYRCYDLGYCPVDIEQIKEVFCQYAKEHNWCRLRDAPIPQERIFYPLERKDFELEDK